MAPAGPGQLSGGQRQRVALARALVNKPKVLLLDEPLGALDLKLREQMQEELKSLQRALGITFVFVTHDQGEALSMADRVAVFNNGRIVQEGYTARYLSAAEDQRFCRRFRRLLQCASPPRPSSSLGGERRWASLRPEAIRIRPQDGGVLGDGAGNQLSRRGHPPFRRQSRAMRDARHRAGRPADPGNRTPCASPRLPSDIHYMDDARMMEQPLSPRLRRQPPILPSRGGFFGRLSDLFLASVRKLLLFLMLTPPLLWLGIIYIGSLIALLLQSFFSIDDFLRNGELRIHARDLCAAFAIPPISTSSCAPS